MSEFDGRPSDDVNTFRILSLDGGGIRGVFPAALLARLEEHLEHPIGRYFDLIAGTSTGGIIAIGLGLGVSASEILELYVEEGPAIFDQQHGAVETSLFTAGQAHSALGIAKIVTGDIHERKAIWRIDQTAPQGRYTLDNAVWISEMRDRAFAEAREQLPELRRHFFGAPAGEFVPFHVH